MRHTADQQPFASVSKGLVIRDSTGAAPVGKRRHPAHGATEVAC
jgi:hypothetical protein